MKQSKARESWQTTPVWFSSPIFNMQLEIVFNLNVLSDVWAQNKLMSNCLMCALMSAQFSEAEISDLTLKDPKDTKSKNLNFIL